MPPMTIEPRIHFLGHSTLLIEIDGIRILTDPCLRDRIGPLVRHGPVPDPDDYRDIDAVLVSHLHLDHLDLASLRMLDGRPTTLVPRGSAPLMRRNRLHDFVELVPGETIRFGGLVIRATHAEHSGFRPPSGPQAVALGFVVEGAGRRVYFAGDTDTFPAMADLDSPDVALVPVWGWGPTLGRGHLDPAGAARALQLIRPRVAVPIHWGTFWPRGLGRVRSGRRTGPAAVFRECAVELVPDVEIAVAQPGQRVHLRHHATVGR